MKVINVRGLTPNDPRVVYCGRDWAGWKDIGLGNPFRVGRDGTLTEVLKKYEEWLLGMLQVMDPHVCHGWRQLKADSVLGCWCKPRRCHADVIKRLWEGR